MAYKPEAAHFDASRELHKVLSARLLADGELQPDDSRNLSVHLPSGLDVVLTDYWSFAHTEFVSGNQQYSDLLRAGDAVLSCQVELPATRRDNPNKPLFIYNPGGIKELAVGGLALHAMAEYTPVGEYTASIMVVSPPNTIPVLDPLQHELVKPFMSY